eukprot:Awhi_evm1s12187
MMMEDEESYYNITSSPSQPQQIPKYVTHPDYHQSGTPPLTNRQSRHLHPHKTSPIYYNQNADLSVNSEVQDTFGPDENLHPEQKYQLERKHQPPQEYNLEKRYHPEPTHHLLPKYHPTQKRQLKFLATSKRLVDFSQVESRRKTSTKKITSMGEIEKNRKIIKMTPIQSTKGKYILAHSLKVSTENVIDPQQPHLLSKNTRYSPVRPSPSHHSSEDRRYTLADSSSLRDIKLHSTKKLAENLIHSQASYPPLHSRPQSPSSSYLKKHHSRPPPPLPSSSPPNRNPLQCENYAVSHRPVEQPPRQRMTQASSTRSFRNEDKHDKNIDDALQKLEDTLLKDDHPSRQAHSHYLKKAQSSPGLNEKLPFSRESPRLIREREAPYGNVEKQYLYSVKDLRVVTNPMLYDHQHENPGQQLKNSFFSGPERNYANGSHPTSPTEAYLQSTNRESHFSFDKNKRDTRELIGTTTGVNRHSENNSRHLSAGVHDISYRKSNPISLSEYHLHYHHARNGLQKNSENRPSIFPFPSSGSALASTASNSPTPPLLLTQKNGSRLLRPHNSPEDSHDIKYIPHHRALEQLEDLNKSRKEFIENEDSIKAKDIKAKEAVNSFFSSHADIQNLLATCSRSLSPSQNKNRRMRTVFSQEQKTLLKEAYDSKNTPDREEITALSKQLNLSIKAIRIWFQNRRAIEKVRVPISPTKPIESISTEAISSET